MLPNVILPNQYFEKAVYKTRSMRPSTVCREPSADASNKIKFLIFGFL